MSMSRRQSRYPGEDTEPTSERELRGWYSYSMAAEVFAVCGVGSFLPITLEQLARENGVLKSDGITSCIAKTSNPAARDLSGWSSIFSRDLQRRQNAPCVVHLFGTDINTSSFTLYTFSISVLVQALALVSLGAIADHGGNRKRLLLILSFTGATACMLFLFLFPSIYLVGSILVVISITCLGTTFVLLNSFLPLLVANHPSIDREAEVPLHSLHSEEEEDGDPDINERLINIPLSTTHIPSTNISPAQKLTNQISSKGVGVGYAAAVLVQILSISILLLFSSLSPSTSKTSIPMRTILFLVGLIWATFTLPTALYLRPRPGPTLASGKNLNRNSFCSIQLISQITFAWTSLWSTIKTATKLRQVVIFLTAWFLLSDAIATISGTAILFARTELQMSTEALALLSITATASGILGAFTWPIIERRYYLQPKHIIIICIMLFEIIPLYGLLGFIPFVKSWGVIGLQQVWEIYPLGFLLGFVMGGLSAYCRAVYGMLVPRDREAAFFALFAVTDKGSSVIGPAVVGSIVDRTGDIRMAFWFLAVLVVLPGPLIWGLDVERGRRDAGVLVGGHGDREQWELLDSS